MTNKELENKIDSEIERILSAPDIADQLALILRDYYTKC